MAELRSRFGKRLRYIRRMRDLTQQQLADKIGVSMEFISLMERGRHGASFEILEKLAEALEVDVSEFFTPPESRK